jgi:membrane-bound lytic murein transglycosylase MltF
MVVKVEAVAQCFHQGSKIGAGRISQLRREAARRGLDPNVWFQNVEYVAAEKIGQETVTYVGNIYKYYIAYSLVMKSQASTKESVDRIRSGARQSPAQSR